MGKVSSKERIVKLIEIFKTETSEEKMLSIDDVIQRLQNEFLKASNIEFSVDRRTIKNDINKLRDNKFYIEEATVEKGKKLYYYAGELFETYEIRILLDAVYSARSITNKERENLTKKIKSLTSKGNSKIYDSKLYTPQMIVSESKLLKYYLNEIHCAIYSNKKLIFQYGNYDMDKSFNLHHSGRYYTVCPYNLVWHNDFYYLVAYDEGKDKIINYRVDRMRDVKTSDEAFELDNNFNIINYLNSCFNMYPGEVSTIEIRFVNKLINAIIDRFGKNVNIVRKDDKYFTIRIDAAINEGLKRWILNWGADAEVISPQSLKDMIKDEIIKMSTIYQD